MKLVYSHAYSQVGLVRSMLENERIPSVIRNHCFMGETTYGLVELWVADEDFFLAQSLINQYQNTPEDQLEDWTCPQCGVQNEGNMGVCWNCDYEIDNPAPQ